MTGVPEIIKSVTPLIVAVPALNVGVNVVELPLKKLLVPATKDVAKGGATKVKLPMEVTLPLGVVTTTSRAPALTTGVVMVIEFNDVLTIVAALPPTVTVAPDR